MSLLKRFEKPQTGSRIRAADSGRSRTPVPIDVKPLKRHGATREVAQDARTSAHQDLKVRLHSKLLQRIDLSVVESLTPEQLRTELKLAIERLLADDGEVMNDAERRQLLRDIENEVLGLGPLEPLLADRGVSEILVNGAKNVFVERRGRLELSDVQFRDNAHLRQIIDRIVAQVGRRIDEVPARWWMRALADGSRVNAIIPPLALDGPAMRFAGSGRSRCRCET